nr:Fanconi anemia core complex-associated protein 100 isoform X2 [Dasypus novemcinctus]
MAGGAPRVAYLAGLGCPAGGLAAGAPRLLRHEAEVFLSAGRGLVHVYDRGGRRLRAVYQFPDQVWHLEFLAGCRALYVLCAGKGIYCLALDPPDRSVDQAEQEDADRELPSRVAPVDPGTRVLPDATLRAFTVLDDALVTLEQGAAGWKMRLFERPCAGNDPRPGLQIAEVEVSCTPPAGSRGERPAARCPPVLCCLAPPGAGAPHRPGAGLTLSAALFGLLFGTDATLLGSRGILCGFPDGQLCCVALKALVAAGASPRDPQALVKVLHHLEEPVVLLGALRTEPLAEEATEAQLAGGDAPSDCLVALGHHGCMLAIRAGWDEAGSPVLDLQEHRLPGPVLCAAWGGGGRVYLSTPAELCVVDLGAAQGVGSSPPPLCPTGLGICSAVALSVLARAPAGGTELLALSARGRLMACSLSQDAAAPPALPSAGKAGQKIKELLSGIGSVSERVSSLKKAVEQRNAALRCLNEAVDVSCALLSGRTSPPPISCSTSTAWGRLPLRDALMATCLLHNGSDHSLGRGWTLCIRVASSSRALDLAAAGPTTTYTVPLEQLSPGGRREVTVPLGPDEHSALNLPITVSCALFYSLREVVEGALAPSDTAGDPFLEESPPDVLPQRAGICLPLSEHTVDLLQCLRFPGLAGAQTPGPQGPTSDPVDSFLGALRGPGCEPTGPAALRAKHLPPSVASIRVSAELLGGALEAARPGGCDGPEPGGAPAGRGDPSGKRLPGRPVPGAPRRRQPHADAGRGAGCPGRQPARPPPAAPPPDARPPRDAAQGGAGPAGPDVRGGRDPRLRHRRAPPAGVPAAARPRPPAAVTPAPSRPLPASVAPRATTALRRLCPGPVPQPARGLRGLGGGCSVWPQPRHRRAALPPGGWGEPATSIHQEGEPRAPHEGRCHAQAPRRPEGKHARAGLRGLSHCALAAAAQEPGRPPPSPAPSRPRPRWPPWALLLSPGAPGGRLRWKQGLGGGTPLQPPEAGARPRGLGKAASPAPRHCASIAGSLSGAAGPGVPRTGPLQPPNFQDSRCWCFLLRAGGRGDRTLRASL